MSFEKSPQVNAGPDGVALNFAALDQDHSSDQDRPKKIPKVASRDVKKSAVYNLYPRYPIEQSAFNLLQEIFLRTKNFTRAARPQLGGRLESAALSCMMHIRRAMHLRDTDQKLAFLAKADLCVCDLKILVQSCYYLRLIPETSILALTERLFSLGQQIGGLMNNVRRRAGRKAQGN